MIEDALQYGALEPVAVDGVVVSSGPGSYTGLRIGVSTAKGFAAAVGADLVAVPSLEGIASGVAAVETGDYVGAAFSARRDEAYVALYRAENGTMQVEKDAEAFSTDDMAAWLQIAAERDRASAQPHGDRSKLWLVGDGWNAVTAELSARGIEFIYLHDVTPSAAAVARIGARKLEMGQTEDLVTFEPYYLKEFVTTKPARTPFEKLSF